MKTCKIVFALILLPSLLCAQSVQLEGYVYEENNRGYLNDTRIKIVNATTDQVVAQTISDSNGVFRAVLVAGETYKVYGARNLFFTKEKSLSTVDKKEGEKVFVKLQMARKPGYIFDVTIAEPRRISGSGAINAIDSARIEVYNNTLEEEELVLEKWPHPTFKFNFERGNHYTIMIRRQGYFNKRIEAYVDVEGCILCFDGLGTIEPGVVDVMSHGNEVGTFLANVELEPLELNSTYKIENIYYDYNKWDIRSDAAVELNNLVSILKDNPAVMVELGSHTDARGTDGYNQLLSEKRAAAAVDYILASSDLDPGSISAKGYGESELVNNCKNGTSCSAARHQENRRTELKVTGIKAVDPLENKSLKQILEDEKIMEEVMSGKILRG